MLRHYLLVVGMAWLSSALSQTFNKRFDLFSEGEGETAWGVEVKPDGSSIVIFNSAYQQGGWFYPSGTASVQVFSDGSFAQGSRFTLPDRGNYPGWANCTSPLFGGGYFVAGSTALVGDTNRVAIYLLDEFGTVTDFFELQLPGQSWIGRGGAQTDSGEFVVVGEMANGPDLDAFLVKTDVQGNVLWVRTYGDPALREGLTSVQPGPWGGYYLGGQREVSLGNYEPYIIRVDDLGFVIGQADYPGPYYRSTNAQLTLAPDGGVWVGGGYNVAAGPEGRRATIYKVDQNGALLWRKLYGPTSRTGFFTVQEVPGSTDLAAAGFNDSLVFGGGITGVLLRTTATGDSLWMRNYAYSDSLLSNGNSGFYDMQPTPDGGFIAVGFAYYAFLADTTYSQDVWVVKVDSMGCIEPGCHLVTGIETQITNLRDALNVAPNPVTSGSTLQVQLKLPENFVPQGAWRITVVSSDGRVVREEQLSSATGALTFTAPPSAGLYHIHLSDAARWISGAKLVVE